MNARRLFDHFVGAGEQRRRDGKSECFGSDQVDDQIELRWLLFSTSFGSTR
jgi:hypothetical protein